MTLDQIKAAVSAGTRVFWNHTGYEVTVDRFGNWNVVCLHNGYTTGLTWADGKTLNGRPDEFFAEGTR